MKKKIAGLLCLALLAAAFPASAPAASAEDAAADNLFLRRDYTIETDRFQAGFADTKPPSLLTDGVYRGDGDTPWKGGDGAKGVTVESLGNHADTEITFKFDTPLTIDTLIFKNVRAFFPDNSCNRHCRVRELQVSTDDRVYTPISFSAPEYRPVEGAPKLNALDGSPGAQFFDIVVELSGAENITALRIFCDTVRPDGTRAYICHFDEIMAHGSETPAPPSSGESAAFTVSFVDWDGVVLKTQSVNYGEDAVPPPDPTRQGFIFVGWSGTCENIVNDCRLTALYDAAFYTISYDANGGASAPAPQKKQHDAPLTPSADIPYKAGCAFLGWASSASADKAQYQPGGILTQNSDLTLYAVWADGLLSSGEIYGFCNCSPAFAAGKYTIDDACFGRLAAKVRAACPDRCAPIINALQEQRNSEWRGSCCGMTSTVVLDKNGQIGLNENFDPGAASLRDVATPGSSPMVQSAINYYQLAQYIPFITADETCLSSSAKWHSVLENLVENARSGRLIQLRYGYCRDKAMYGHALVVTGYEEAGGDGHKLRAYDCRCPDDEAVLLVDGGCQSCVVNGKERAFCVDYFADFSGFDLIDIDGGDNSAAPGALSAPCRALAAADTGTANSYITVLAEGDVLVTNASGKTIEIRDGRIGGTMEIVSLRLIAASSADRSPAPLSFMFEVAASEEFRVSSEDGRTEASAISPEMYASGAADSGTLIFREGKGVYLTGSAGAYRAALSLNSGSCDLLSISGTDDAEVALEYEDGYATAEGAVGNDLCLTVFSNTVDVENICFSSYYDKIKIDAAAGNTEVRASSGKDGVYDINVLELCALPGDVTGDGRIDNLDAAMILRYDAALIGMTQLMRAAGDVNSDDAVDNLDAAKVLRHDAGVIDLLRARLCSGSGSGSAFSPAGPLSSHSALCRSTAR